MFNVGTMCRCASVTSRGSLWTLCILLGGNWKHPFVRVLTPGAIIYFSMADYCEEGQFSDAEDDNTQPFEVLVPGRALATTAETNEPTPELLTQISDEDLGVDSEEDEDFDEEDEDLDLNYGDQWFSASGGWCPNHVCLVYVDR